MLFSLKRRFLAISPVLIRSTWDRIEASPLGYRLARGAFWVLAGALVSRGLSLLSSIITARLLGKTGFGELGVIQSTVGMFGTFAGLGMGLTATKYVAEFRSKDPARAERIIALTNFVSWVSGLILVVILLVFAPWIAKHTLAAPHLAGALRASCLLLLFGAVNGAQTGVLAGFEAFKAIARINLVAGVLSFPVTVYGAWCAGVTGAVWGACASSFLSCLISHLALQKLTRVSLRFSDLDDLRSEVKVLWQFSLPAVLGGIFVSPVAWGCNAMLVNQPGGYLEMGTFNAANQWLVMIMFVPNLLSQSALPVFCEQASQNGGRAARRLLLKCMAFNIVAGAPAMLLVCILSRQIMRMYGEQFTQAWPVLVMTALVAGIMAVQQLVGTAIFALSGAWKNFFVTGIWGICAIGLTSAWVSHGAFGVASARLVAYILATCISFGVVLSRSPLAARSLESQDKNFCEHA